MRSSFLAASLVALSVLAPPPGIAQQEPAAIAARLGNDVHSRRVPAADSDVDWGRAIGVVNAPFEQVADSVRNYAEYRHFLPFFTQSRVVSRRGARALVYMEARVMHGAVTLWANMRMGARPPQGDTEIIEGRMADGNMAAFRARWEVSPLDGGRRALVVLKVLIDPDLPLPDSVCSNENVSTARRSLRALRRFLGAAPPTRR